MPRDEDKSVAKINQQDAAKRRSLLLTLQARIVSRLNCVRSAIFLSLALRDPFIWRWIARTFAKWEEAAGEWRSHFAPRVAFCSLSRVQID
jgi:hypothetical protein